MITGTEFFDLITHSIIYGILFGFLAGIVLGSINKIR